MNSKLKRITNKSFNSKYSSKERFNYLQQLLHEFNISSSKDAKREVLANLSNFAYNPINYAHLQKLNLIGIFLSQLNAEDMFLAEIAISGLCNLCNDFINLQTIYQTNGLQRIINRLKLEVENMNNINIIISSLTIFIFFNDFYFQMEERISAEIKDMVTNISNTSIDVRVKNLAHIYLQSCSN